MNYDRRGVKIEVRNLNGIPHTLTWVRAPWGWLLVDIKQGLTNPASHATSDPQP